MVESLWAITIEVRPCRSRSIACCISSSVSVSTLDVASSRISTRGSWARARAKERSCFCPTESVAPRSCTGVSYPSGSESMKRETPTVSAAATAPSRVIDSFDSVMFSRIVPRKRKTSCITRPISRLRSEVGMLRISRPSISTLPAENS